MGDESEPAIREIVAVEFVCGHYILQFPAILPWKE